MQQMYQSTPFANATQSLVNTITYKDKNTMSTTEQKTLLQQQLDELIKVGVGGKFKNNNTEDYTKRIQDELEFEEAMIRGGITRYQKLIKDAVLDNQESTTLYGIVLQQKYITKLSDMINEEIKLMIKGVAGNKQTALKLICQCLPKTAFINGVFIDFDLISSAFNSMEECAWRRTVSSC